MLFSFEELAKLFHNHQGNAADTLIERVMFDSRDVLEKSLFVPIKGSTYDSHQFIEQAIENGAIATIWDEKNPIPEHLLLRCHFFLVSDPLVALHQIASYYRQKINPIVIGITGSNGKTTTKDLVSAVLATTYKTHKTSGNYNNHIGLPMTILQMPEQTEVLVVEMGMNNFKEIELLSKIAKPDYAIVTNIGESHIEFLGSREGIAQAKLEILYGLKENGTIIIDGDEPLLTPVKQEKKAILCGFSNINDYIIKQVAIDVKATTFQIDERTYKIPLLGEHHAKNASFAIALAKALKLTDEQIQQGLASLEHSKMRFEQLTGKNGVAIINDAYNASPTSMKAAIKVVRELKQWKYKVLVLGDILELGNVAEQFHLDVAKTIDNEIDVVFTIGNHAKVISDYVKEHITAVKHQHFNNKEQLITSLQPHLNEDTVILFKASRGMQLEKIIEQIIER